ncbi:hypothetical protein JTB14_025184 [Gonioctena quinquepunctata]|nr:hypothetical protein JTB14_025184 [Gonioctena quinquepunctata]
MNKQKTVIKKTLIRNTEKPVQKFKVTTITDAQTLSKEPDNLNSDVVQNLDKITSEKLKTQPKFDSPKLYSTLKLSQKIDNIVKPRKTKSCSDVVIRKLAAEEKVTRKVNFPYSEPIYKDLIPLSCEQTHAQPLFQSREPLPQKDKEPLLSDFTHSGMVPNYYNLPNIKLENKVFTIASNNLKLYKLIELNDK